MTAATSNAPTCHSICVSGYSRQQKRAAVCAPTNKMATVLLRRGLSRYSKFIASVGQSKRLNLKVEVNVVLILVVNEFF